MSRKSATRKGIYILARRRSMRHVRQPCPAPAGSQTDPLGLLWLKAFFHREVGSLKRIHTLKERTSKPQFFLRGDASTSGMGDILLDANGNPISFWADSINSLDRERLNTCEGDPAFMGEWELLRILVSLHVWGPKLRGMSGAFVIQADSQAALGAALKLCSPRTLMNVIAAEISLVMERYNIEKLVGEHFRGTLNVEADALSRLWEGADLPPSLRSIPRANVPCRDDTFYQAWPSKKHRQHRKSDKPVGPVPY